MPKSGFVKAHGRAAQLDRETVIETVKVKDLSRGVSVPYPPEGAKCPPQNEEYPPDHPHTLSAEIVALEALIAALPPGTAKGDYYKLCGALGGLKASLKRALKREHEAQLEAMASAAKALVPGLDTTDPAVRAALPAGLEFYKTAHQELTNDVAGGRISTVAEQFLRDGAALITMSTILMSRDDFKGAAKLSEQAHLALRNSHEYAAKTAESRQEAEALGIKAQVERARLVMSQPFPGPDAATPGTPALLSREELGALVGAHFGPHSVALAQAALGVGTKALTVPTVEVEAAEAREAQPKPEPPPPEPLNPWDEIVRKRLIAAQGMGSEYLMTEQERGEYAQRETMSELMAALQETRDLNPPPRTYHQPIATAAQQRRQRK